ncbi:MAG: toll/interleukin-1 receptor domain-containing protein [Eubacterium sp.]|nr:toll/interleukin-1 receptor domain-containing protein [Eubacterium sp.]
MGKRIKNRLNGVSIGGNYIGGDVIVDGYADQETAGTGSKSNDKTIFLSYNWHDGETADRIDRHLSKIQGITVKRDVRDIGVWKSIREFMEGIRQQDYAVLIVSDSYLRSKNCMFEVTEMMKEREYADRIFPAVVETGIYDPLVRAEYIRYWQQECDKLEDAVKGLEPANAVELATDLKRYKNIFASVGEFLSIVADRNNPDIREMEVQIEKAVLKNRLIQRNHYYPMFQDSEREFIVTKDEDIKPAAYFTGREIELRDLR